MKKEKVIDEKNVSAAMLEAKQILDGLYGNKRFLTGDLELIKRIEFIGCDIIWDSSAPKILSNEGKCTRSYTENPVSLTATIDYFGNITQIKYNFIINGYKDLSTSMAASYIYRNYDKLDEIFFDTIDLVYCSFALIDYDGNMNDDVTKACLENVKTYITPRAKHNGVWVIISIGGAGQLTQFSKVAANEALRKAFAANIVSMINEYDLDGVDIDWELPTIEEKTNFTILMKEVYMQVKANNPNHLVTSAIAGGMWQPAHYDLKNSIQYMDYINMMTYSMVANSGYYHNALHASTNGKTSLSCSIVESIDIYHSYGILNNKIVIGFAFYGHRQKWDPDESIWKGNGTVFYDDILKEYIENGYVEYYDEECEVPYILSDDKNVFISYDNPRSIIAKCEYAIKNKLGGVMYWENGCDTTGILIAAIKDGFKK